MDTYDLLIIGGGINGTAIAADAAGRGLSVLLVERSDLGSGTSAASSKLIHGGLRYLQYGEIGLVREALRDREILLRKRPHLVRPIELLIPAREGGPVPPWKLELGLRLYDGLAGATRLPRHRRLSRTETLRREPDLEAAGLLGGFVYPDAQVVFPERLCLELAREAAEAGAVVRTHTEVVGLRREGERVVGAWLQDARRQAAGMSEGVTARLTVNATGAWVDTVRRLTGARLPPLLGATKGSHLVLRPTASGPRGPIYAAAKSDGRPFFVLPWRETLLVGTTDIRYQGDPAAVAIEPFEVEYLLEETAALFPRAHLTAEEILYTYTGLRPLPLSPHGWRAASPPRATRPAPAGRITRRHQVLDHTAEGAPGLWSIVGGKLTTHRSLAEQTVNRAMIWLQGGEPGGTPCRRRSWTARGELDLTALRRSAAAAAAGLPLAPDQVEHLVALYGPRVEEVLERAHRNPAAGARICPRNPDIAAQIEQAVEREWAVTLADLLMRRTGIGTSACLGLDCAEYAAEWMGRAAGWSEARRAEEIGDYRQLVARCLSANPGHGR